MITPGGITIGNTLSTGTKFYLNAAYGSNATMSLYDSNAAERIRATAGTSGGTMRVYGSSTSYAVYDSTTITLLSGGYVDAGAYKAGVVSGVTNTVSPVTSISTGTNSFVTGVNTNLITINYKDHSSTNQTVSFLAFASTNLATGISSVTSSTTSLAFTGGIRTT